MRPSGMLIAAVCAFVCAMAPRPLAAQGGVSTTPEDSVRAVELARGQALLHADTLALSRMVADE